MNLGKEILYSINRCIILLYLSVYIFPSAESKLRFRCNRMREMAVSIMAVCYCFTGINIIFIIYYIYLMIYKKQPTFQILLIIKLDFLDVFLFFILSVNMVTLNFVYDSGCGEFSDRMMNVLTVYWVIISISALLGYFIYQKIFLRIEAQLNQQQQNQNQDQQQDRNDLEIVLMDL